MNDITLNLITLSVFILIGGGIFLLVRRQQTQQEREIIQKAAEKGWKYELIREPLTWGLRLSSTHWTLEAISRSTSAETAPGSSNVGMSTTWWTKDEGSPVFIGSRTSSANLGGFGDLMVRQVLKLALGNEADGLAEIQVGSDVFRQRFMIWAQDAGEAEKLISPASESALLSWKGITPLIKRTLGRLQVEIPGVRVKKIDQINAIVQLGEALLAGDHHQEYP